MFLGEPGAVGEGEFQLVAVVVDVFRSADGAHERAVDVAEAFQVVAHLLLLGGELRRVTHGLPLASAAGAEVGASGVDAVGREGVEEDGAAFGVVLFLFI